ncbi:hypothetical protein MMC19_000071 [Ptychographa xylographoides]|nr:hypothetical protein [Ptychographa xylographoides]
MNANQQYTDSQHSHLSGGPPYTPQSQTSGGMAHYPQYQQQAPPLQPIHGSYAPSPSYGQYGYATGVTSPQNAGQPVAAPQMNSQQHPLPAMAASSHPQHAYGAHAASAQAYQQQQAFDATGQVAPPGMKPRVTATLWEDEGSLCFQVEAKGVCVARREDNHMINGTKLLNVAGMTRGRRDGILKSEKMRHVVKIGPMHLKGVWIPFERALDFANREKITELLYPLFVHNIGALLYHPTNSSRTNMVVQAAERRKMQEKQQQQTAMLGGSGSQPPALHHHHSMSSQMTPHVPQPVHSIAPHPGAGRPALDRAHTFPTPPTSASSIIGNSANSYEWGGQGMSNGVQATQPLSIDTGLSNTRSMPSTPATTPPGNSIHSMQSYQNPQPYDSSRPMYSAAPQQQTQYASQQNVAQHNLARFGQPMQPNSYIKNEMGPPSSRTTGSGAEGEHVDIKVDPYSHSQGNEQVGHGTGEEEAEHEHDTEYAHDNSTAYNANRGPYNYNAGPTIGSIHGEHPHLSPEQMNGSPHANGSGRGTPRNGSVPQSQWTPGYNTPPRVPPSSNLYNVMSDARTTTNGSTVDTYTPAPLQAAYAPTATNGAVPGKRGREEEDQDHSRPGSGGESIDALKRRKTGREGSISTPTGTSFDRDSRPMNRPRSNIIQQRAR